MSLFDIVLLALLALSAIGGYRVGLLIRVGSLVGLVGGIAGCVFTVPLALDLVAPTTAGARIGTLVGAFVVTLGVSSLVAQSIAVQLRRAIAGTPLDWVDSVGGAAAGIAGTLLSVWLLAPLAGMIPGPLAREVRASSIVQTVRAFAPSAPNPLASLQGLLSDFPYPEVFADLAPAPATQPPPSAIPVPQEVVDRVAASTVKVEASGCGSSFAGSGWTAADETVVTNAHVVAGADFVQVLRPDGERIDAEVVVFDDDRDLAVLRVPGLGQRPLALGTAETGEGAATFGHPAGQDRVRVAPATVSDLITAVGRDISGDDETSREVVVLGAELQQGDSGSAAVDAAGTVVGTVFAISPDDRATAYALSNEEVRAVLDAPRAPWDTGRCQ